MERNLLYPTGMSRLRFTLICLVTVVACNSGNSTQYSGVVSSLAHQLTLQGKVTNAAGTPITANDISIKFTAGGVDLFLKPNGDCRTDPHMQGGTIVSTTSDSAGSYAASADLEFFSSVANSSCKLIKTLGELDSLEIDFSVDATQDLCTAYCQASGPSDTAGCVSNCLNGNRKLTATQTLSHDQLVNLDKASVNGTATTILDFKIATLGPKLSSLHGADLTVDGAAAESTAHVTTETFAATDCPVVEGCVAGPGLRRLLRFDGTIQNLGDSDFVLGSPESNPLFKYSACHNHYHLQDIMLYELLSADTKKPVAVGGTNVVGRKQGFCMEDIDQVAGDANSKFDCEYQGVSAGWADVYDSDLDCQWIDVTGVPPGKYVLRITVNPIGRYSESDPSNNSADAVVTIPAQ
jgi:hypothetical protein